ncbi:MAG: adenylate/guanylate cyclase domain-containing protein [Candidatus Limnocylindrales bacterium]
MVEHREIRLVTCLFIDVVGSTETTVQIGPERMQRLLSAAFAEISGTVQLHGGIVEKFVGDAVLAIFGVAVSHPDDAERALRAAEACVRWSTVWAGAGGLAVRVGIETGELLVDPKALETKQRMVMGESINLAARLQSYAQPGQVVVGPGCHEATEGIALFEALGGLELKGFGTVEAWRFDGFLGPGAAVDIAFVGRDPELAMLGEAFDRARDNVPSLALIVGPPGQGKSRLAREAIRRSAGVRVLEARCRPEAGENSPLRQLVVAEVGAADAGAVRDRIDRLLGTVDGADVAAAVNHSGGLAVDERLLLISRHEQRELIARQWQRYLSAVAAEVPLCLFVEDLHWGDPLLLRVLDYVTSSPSGRLLGLATARPEFLGSAHLRPRVTRVDIELGPLDDASAVRLAELAGGAGDAALSVQRAAGHPLFLIELARVRARGPRLPLTVQAAITARLDELSPGDRQLIQATSVAGERFDARDAAVLAEWEPSDVAAALARVSQLGFITPDGDGFRFHHALVRDVVYGRLPVTERMGLHARYAVEGVDAGDPVAQAHHWWEALKPPDAAWVWEDAVRHGRMRAEAHRIHIAAGTRLEERNAYEQALEVNQRAVELAETTTERAWAEAEVGRLFGRLGRGDDSWAHRLTALDLYGGAAERPPAKVYADMLEMVTFNWGWFHHLPADAEVLRLLTEGEALARASGDDVSLARLLAERASFTESAAGLDEIRRFVESDDPVPFADAAQRMATVLLFSARIGDAVRLFEAVFDKLLPAGANINTPEALAWYGAAAFTSGDLRKATSIAQQFGVESEHRSVHTRSHYHALRALVAFGRGDWAGLRESAEDGRQLAERNPDASMCLLSAAAAGYAAASKVLAGAPLPADVDAQAMRHVEDSEKVRAASVMLPKAMAGDAGAIRAGLTAYQDGLSLSDRSRVWDPADIIPAISLTVLERWDDLAPVLARLDVVDTAGARLAGAVAAAIREERLANPDGPAPSHTLLRELGYLGLSQLLRFRPTRTVQSPQL